MNEVEAMKVIDIMLSADGGCPVCAGELLIAFAEEFPQYEELAKEMYEDYFEQSLES